MARPAITSIRPATLEDFINLREVPPKTARAFAVVKDTNVIGIGGIYRDGENKVLFSELTDEIRRDKRSLIGLIRAVKTLMRGRVFSFADPDIDGSEVLLRHMGFEHFQGRFYQWHS